MRLPLLWHSRWRSALEKKPYACLTPFHATCTDLTFQMNEQSVFGTNDERPWYFSDGERAPFAIGNLPTYSRPSQHDSALVSSRRPAARRKRRVHKSARARGARLQNVGCLCTQRAAARRRLALHERSTRRRLQHVQCALALRLFRDRRHRRGASLGDRPPRPNHLKKHVCGLGPFRRSVALALLGRRTFQPPRQLQVIGLATIERRGTTCERA